MPRRDGAKTKSRGQKLAYNATTTTIQESQAKNNDETMSPLRNKDSHWKAHAIESSRSPSTSPARQDMSQNKANPKGKYPSVNKDSIVPQTKEHASTPKASSSSSHPLGIIRSASTSSAQKQNNNTTTSGGLRRSVSDDSSLVKKNTALPPTGPVNELPTATNKKKKTKVREGSPTNSDIESPVESENENDKPPRGGASSVHKTPQDKTPQVRETDTRSSNKKSKSSGGSSSAKTPQDKSPPVRTTDTRSSNKKRKAQTLDSDSNSDDDFETSSVPSPKSNKGSAQKLHKQHPLDLSSSDAAIGNINLLCCSQALYLCILFCVQNSSYNCYTRVDVKCPYTQSYQRVDPSRYCALCI